MRAVLKGGDFEFKDGLGVPRPKSVSELSLKAVAESTAARIFFAANPRVAEGVRLDFQGVSILELPKRTRDAVPETPAHFLARLGRTRLEAVSQRAR